MSTIIICHPRPVGVLLATSRSASRTAEVFLYRLWRFVELSRLAVEARAFSSPCCCLDTYNFANVAVVTVVETFKLTLHCSSFAFTSTQQVFE